MRLILSLLLILSAQSFLSYEIKAQAQAPASLSITVRDEEGDAVVNFVTLGTITFTANIAGIVPTDSPTFNWTISAGKIIGGQGTATIKVDASENIGAEIIATVEVSGVSSLSAKRDNRASTTIRVTEFLCPNLHIECPTDALAGGPPINVSLSMSGVSPRMNPQYKWKVSAGKIITGQGTPEISVEMSENPGETITATVEVAGITRPECPKVASCEIRPLLCILPLAARKFDEYSALSWKEEASRLDNLALQLQQEPSASGYIIIYGTRNVAQHIARSRQRLVEKRGIDAGRIVLVNGGENKKTRVELWVVPTGAEPPKPEPNY